MGQKGERLPGRLRALCDRLVAAGDLRSGVEAVAKACDDLFGFYRVALVLPTRRPNRFYVAAAWGRTPEEELEGYEFTLRAHPLERTVTEGISVVRLDPMGDHEDETLTRLYRGEGKVEEMAVPVPLGTNRGLLVFASREKGRFGGSARAWAEDVGRIFGPWARAWAGYDAPHTLREQYETLLEGALDGIAVLADGGLAYANASFREIFGIDPSSPLPRDLRGLLDPGSRASLSDSLKTLSQRPRVLPRLEAEASGRDGRRLHLELGLQRIDYQGEPAVLLQVHNATERAEREQEIRDASARTDALLLTLTHDIRGPLTTILGFSDLLLDEIDGVPPDRVRETLGVVSRAGRSLKALVEGLLEYTSLGANEAPMTNVKLEPLLAEVERELEGALLRSEAKVDYRRIPPAVRARPVEAARVFKNLLENAIRYARVGETPRVLVSCTGEEAGFYVFCVEDNGAGIEAERQQEVFQLFKRGRGGGAGVGLALVERIVIGHGGRIWIESDPGRGSRFYFTLPKPSEGPA